MIRESYRLNQPILSIHSDDHGTRIPLTVPPGAVVVVTNGPLDGQRMVDVQWDGKIVMMFTVDLRARATLTSMPTREIKVRI